MGIFGLLYMYFVKSSLYYPEDMSPECNWIDVPRNIREKVKHYLGDAGLARLLNSELGFFITEKFESIGVDILTPSQCIKNIDNAKRSEEFYYIHSLKCTKRAKNTRKTLEKNYGDITPEEAESKRGHSKHYKGKHRSDTKGKGIKAFFRSTRYPNKKG